MYGRNQAYAFPFEGIQAHQIRKAVCDEGGSNKMTGSLGIARAASESQAC